MNNMIDTRNLQSFVQKVTDPFNAHQKKIVNFKASY